MKHLLQFLVCLCGYHKWEHHGQSLRRCLRCGHVEQWREGAWEDAGW